ncbi:unnamed protein product [Colias eurytheme]|nr:unnamed protein product [Colias eurytheme]
MCQVRILIPVLLMMRRGEIHNFLNMYLQDEIVVPFINLNECVVDAGQGNYVCGWILGKCIKNVTKNCKHCKNDMYGDPEEKTNAYIKAKEYNKCKASLGPPRTRQPGCGSQAAAASQTYDVVWEPTH